ncbi:replication factor C subunit 4 [Brevipalpus obovatus]|uniref:replication factor C subunit 4 n=1 Tax=Brevipalpus obovatus TaxID=246614 RepID=UPI003D9E5522
MAMSDKREGPIVPWVEKYRPKSVEEVVFQEEAVNVLRECLKGGDFPNLLFYGPPGTGKTSTILALAREMFKDMFPQRVLELNASDERGIQVIREKVKRFAQQTAASQKIGGGTIPPFKIIILDEADSMTHGAQACLRRVMEKECKSTRFCIICNYISRIIDPIVSRCSKFRFKPLHPDLVLGKLQEICEKEQIQLTDVGVLNELIRISDGDLRKAITFLQTAFRLKGKESKVTFDDVREITGYIPEKVVTDFMSACEKHSYEKVEDFLDDLVAEGYSASQLITQIHDWVLSDNCSFTDTQLARIMEAIAVADHRLLEGANEFVQTFQVGSEIIQALRQA